MACLRPKTRAIPTLKCVQQLLSWLFLALIVFFGKSQISYAKSFNVGKAYQEAQSDYKKGKPQQALKTLSKIHKRYPGFKPAQALSGKIYYQMGKLEKAARFFKRAGSESILPDNAFAYGSSMFEVGNYREAVKGFREVPKKSKERVYADFYSGIAQFRMQRYDLALAQLRRAKDRDLPASFRTAKRKLLKVIDQKRLAERRGGSIATTGPYVYVPPPPAPQAPLGVAPGADAASGATATPEATAAADGKKEEKKEEKKPDAPKTGITYNITPSGTYKVEDSQASGAAIETKTQKTTTTLGVSGVVNYMFEPSMGEQPMVGVTIGGKMSTNSSKASNVSLFAYDDDPETILTAETATRSAGKTQELSAVPNASTAITEHVSVDAKYTYLEIVPDSKPEKKRTETTPFAQVEARIGDTVSATLVGSTRTVQDGANALPGQATDTIYSLSLSTTIESLTLKGGYKQTETDNPEYGNLSGFKSVSTIDLGISGAVSDITGNAGVSQTTNTAPEGVNVAGPASTLTISGSVTIPFQFGTSLTLDASQTQNKDVLNASLATEEKDEKGAAITEVGTAQTEETKMAATLKIAPVDWFYLKLGVEQKTTSTSASNPEQQEAFDKVSTIDFLKTFVELGLSKTF